MITKVEVNQKRCQGQTHVPTLGNILSVFELSINGILYLSQEGAQCGGGGWAGHEPAAASYRTHKDNWSVTKELK